MYQARCSVILQTTLGGRLLHAKENLKLKNAKEPDKMILLENVGCGIETEVCLRCKAQVINCTDCFKCPLR